MPSMRRRGKAEVVLECHDDCKASEFGKPEVITLKHSYPLRIVIPSHAGSKNCKWMYPVVYGGRLGGGDHVEIDIKTKPNTCGLLTSQGPTKVYHSEDGSQTIKKLNFMVEDNSLLCVIPDYCVCYEGANFYQNQTVDMTDKANLVLLDWLVCGREAIGEAWAFSSYKNSLLINVNGEALFNDTTHLHNTQELSIQQSFKNYKVIGSCVVLGRKMREHSNNLYKLYSNRLGCGDTTTKDVICSASMIQKRGLSGIVLNFIATDTEKAFTVIKDIVHPLIPMLGSDPFYNKYK